MTMSRWRRVRQAVQLLSFLVVLALVIYTVVEPARLWSARTLLALDPLAGLTAMLAQRRWLALFLPSLLLLAGTLVLGRFWCGWLCPLGTLLDWTAPRKDHVAPGSRWQGVKYGVLFTTLFLALWGNLTLLALDPLTIVVRSITALVLPALTWLVTQAQIALYPIRVFREPLMTLDVALRGTVLSAGQPHYTGVALLAGLLAGVLALNLLARRGWCRFLCPLGALYGLAARVAWLRRRVTPDCVACGLCARTCAQGAIAPERGYASNSGECTLCMDCAAACPKEAIRVDGTHATTGKGNSSAGWRFDPTRRQALGALGISVGMLGLFKIGAPAHRPAANRLRPPGSQEEHLLAACVRCGACVRACPTHGLQFSLSESGVEGLLTPILAPRLGPCDYACTACGQACPTGAIPRLELAEKRETVIGKAYIDPRMCIPWSGRGECIVCEEMCPLPQKAIVLQERALVSDDGLERTLQLPVVRHERCIGCGLCEAKCPIHGEAAIRVMVDPME
ncbi:MAG: 4Fe-4S dicluster domain-containing protein [Anaerolineae bacterium]